MAQLHPCLSFDSEAEEAVNFYTSVFPSSRIIKTARYGDAGPKPAGTVMTISFEIAGQSFMALNGGPSGFTPAVSMVYNCGAQDELDEVWDKLTSDGGKPIQCGWCEDKFGLSWQIVPKQMDALMSEGDEAKRNRVFAAMLKMIKIEVAELQAAAEAG